ncbi:TRAP transporter small permease [Georgenia sp. Z1344]|uniref:TRAP transporter small permease n=1 Tax=Georgenia sp. Z1344 TaxID=3416706 RepID=UPI003CEBA83C
MNAFVLLTERVSRVLAWGAGLGVVAMLAVIIGNYVLRLFGQPLAGTFELVSLCSIIVGALALGEAQVYKAHVAIDIVTVRLPKKVQLVVGAIVTVASIALMVQVVLALTIYSSNMTASGASTDFLKLPIGAIVWILVVGFGGLVLALLGDLGRVVRAWRDRSPELDIW